MSIRKRAGTHVRYFRRGWSVALIVLLAPAGLAASYEVQIAREQHDRFIKTAKVWHEPQPDDLLSGEANGDKILDRLDCEFVPYKFPGGATPKFLCAVLDDSGNATKDIVKIKYGRDNREIPGEVAGGRLLRHLGFGGDHMQVARTLVCYGAGCPKGRPSEPIQPLATRSQFESLEWVSVERRMEGHELNVADKQGFSLSELASARRTDDEEARVERLSFREGILWKQLHREGRIRLDRGPHFPAVRISEDGRQFLLKKLEAMIDSPDHNQIRNLFAGAHMEMDRHSTIDGWVKVFVAKVREIEGAGPCDRTLTEFR